MWVSTFFNLLACAYIHYTVSIYNCSICWFLCTIDDGLLIMIAMQRLVSGWFEPRGLDFGRMLVEAITTSNKKLLVASCYY